MHSLATPAQVRQRLSGNAQVPRSARSPSALSQQRFAATKLCRSLHWLQFVSGAAATRKALPSFIAGSRGGMNNHCSSSQRWRVGGQLSKSRPRRIGLLQHLGSSRAVLPNPSLERTATGKALGPRASRCHYLSRGPSAFPAPSAQLKR